MARRLLVLLITLLTLIPLALMFTFKNAPAGAHVQSLLGTWQYSPDGKVFGPKTLEVPESFARRMYPAPDFWIHRAVELDTGLAGQRLYLTLGDLGSGVAEVFFDGKKLGEMGDFETGATRDWVAFGGLEVSAQDATVGPHLVALHLKNARIANGALGDHRLWLGRAEALKPFAQQAAQVEAFLRSAPLAVMVLLSLLLFVLTRLSSDEGDRRGALFAAMMLLSNGAYLASFTGIGFSSFASQARVTVCMMAIPCMGVFTLLFTEQFFRERLTRFAKAMAIAAVGLALWTFVEMALFDMSMTRSYTPSELHAAIIVLYTCGLAAVMTVRRWRRGAQDDAGASSLPMLVALFVTFGCGLVDVLTDSRVIAAPRLYVLASANVPLMAGIMVVMRFLGIYRRNASLTASLTERNAELATALAEAREATRLKGEFVAGISHELRTPLNSIINIPEGLLEDFEGDGDATRFMGSPKDTAQYLHTLHKNGVHLLSIVNQLLDFSKLDAGKMSLDVAPVRVRTVAEDVAKTVASAFADRKVELELLGDLDAQLRADGVKLAQVLLNLLSNAVKFSPVGAKVSLTAKDEGPSVTFAVRDEGIGIAPENHELVFESFRQVEGGSTRRFGGTGLGLPIAKQLVELHGGTLWLQSAPGQGSTFSFRLPKTPLPRPTASPSGKASVLLVDDDAFTLESLRLSLRELPDVELLALDNPDKVLPTISQHKPTVVILDVMMPKLSGLSILRSIRESAEGQKLPVLVLSAYPANREVALGLGASWMDKPWNAEALRSEVLRLLGRDLSRAA